MPLALQDGRQLRHIDILLLHLLLLQHKQPVVIQWPRLFGLLRFGGGAKDPTERLASARRGP
jgi:hypothetical protein